MQSKKQTLDDVKKRTVKVLHDETFCRSALYLRSIAATIHFDNGLFLQSLLFVLTTTILLTQQSLLNDVFGSPPRFARQEVHDGVNDVISINDYNQTITYAVNSNTQSQEIDSLDIRRVSYFSDGETLNATIWLYNLDKNFTHPNGFLLNFGILIDVNPNPAIGVGGVDFHKEIANYQINDLPNNKTSFWIENIHEATSDGPHRYLNASEKNYNYTGVFQYQIEKTHKIYYLPVSVDLRTSGSPDKYKVMFYISSFTDDGKILDFTSWIDIPSPIYTMSTTPSPLQLRVGSTGSVGVVLKSNVGSVYKVANYSNLENDSGIQVITAKGNTNKSSFGVEPVPFEIIVPEKAQTGEYAIPMLATISTGSAIPSEFIGVNKYNSSLPTESLITTVTNLTVNVLDPLTSSEIFKDFWDVYGDLIGLIGGGFAAGFSALVFDRLNRKRKDKGIKKTLD